MGPALWLLQIANAGLAGASAYIFYVAPGAWMDQAQAYFCLTGAIVGAITFLFGGGSRMFGSGVGPAIHGGLGLAFIGAQAYWLWSFSGEIGLLEFLRRSLHL